MQLASFGTFYLGIESDKYCDFSIHLGNLLIEYQCPHAKPKSNGTIQNDDRSGDGEASKSDGAI